MGPLYSWISCEFFDCSILLTFGTYSRFSNFFTTLSLISSNIGTSWPQVAHPAPSIDVLLDFAQKSLIILWNSSLSAGGASKNSMGSNTGSGWININHFVSTTSGELGNTIFVPELSSCFVPLFRSSCEASVQFLASIELELSIWKMLT